MIRRDYPTVNLLPGSQQALAEGDAQQESSCVYAYNQFGQIIRFVDQEENTSVYTYYSERDPNGDLVIDNPGGHASTGGYRRFYDGDTSALPPGRNTANGVAPVARRCEFYYNPVGICTRYIDGRGTATDYSINSLNQIVQITRAAAVGLLSIAADPPEATTLNAHLFEEKYFYDANNNIVAIQVEDRGDTSGTGGASTTSTSTTFSTARSRRAPRSAPAPPTSLPNTAMTPIVI